MGKCIQNKYDSGTNISIVFVIEENGMIFGEMASKAVCDPYYLHRVIRV